MQERRQARRRRWRLRSASVGGSPDSRLPPLLQGPWFVSGVDGREGRGVEVRLGRRWWETRRARVGSCRSAGRRERGGDCGAHRSPDRRIRGCRRSYRGRGSCRVSMGGKAGAWRFVSGVGGGKRVGRALVHVGAPAGAKGVEIAERIGRRIAGFAAAAAPTGACRFVSGVGGEGRGVVVRVGRRGAGSPRVRAGSGRSAGRREGGGREGTRFGSRPQDSRLPPRLQISSGRLRATR